MDEAPHIKGRENEREHPALDAEALFVAHAPFVASFLLRMGTPPSDVEDIVQEVFMIAHQKGGYVSGPAAPRSWLAAISVRVLSNKRRSRLRKREDFESPVLMTRASEAPSPEESVQARESLLRVQRALDQMDPDHRAPFILYEIEHESCQTIADLLGVPVGTVYSRLHTARKQFLAAYEQSTVSAAQGIIALAGVL